MMEIKFKYEYFKFNQGENFTIRRGVHADYHRGDNVILKSVNPLVPQFGRRILAFVTNVQILRFGDIPAYSSWHLKNEYDSDSSYVLSDAAFEIMKDIYGKDFSYYEIVTLIWFRPKELIE